MPGIIIYKTKYKHYYDFDFPNQTIYRNAKSDIRKNDDTIIWKKGNVSQEQVEKSREKRKNLIALLNEGKEIDLKKELDILFQ